MAERTTAMLRESLSAGDFDCTLRTYPQHVVEVPCECTRCQRSEYLSKQHQICLPQIFRYEVLPIAENFFGATHVAAKLATGYHEVVQIILRQHGAKLVKRWRRKTPAQRTRSLLVARPNLCPESDHVFLCKTVGMNGENKNAAMLGTSSFMLPYLNVEALSENSNNLLSLLYYRANHSLSEFAILDAEQFQLAWALNLFPHTYAPHCVSIRKEDYGKCQHMDLKALHRGDVLGFPKATLVFQAQVQLMLFFIEILASLLHDEPPPATWRSLEMDHDNLRSNLDYIRHFCDQVVIFSTRSATNAPTAADHANDSALAQHILRTSSQTVVPQWTSLYAKRRAQPFSSPPEFNIDELVELSRSRLVDVQDDLWLLQTDPKYFHDRMEYLQHQYASFFTVQSRARVITIDLESLRKGVFESLHVTTEWFDLVQALEAIRICKIRACNRIRVGHDLPADYDEALALLWLRTTEMLKNLRSSLQATLAASPAFKDSFKVQLENGLTKIIPMRDNDIGKAFKKDKISSLIYIVSCDPEILQYDPMSALKQLDDALASTPDGSSRAVDSFLSTMLSDICLLESIRQACNLHRPHHGDIQLEAAFKLPDAGWQRMRAMFRSLQPLVENMPEKTAVGEDLEFELDSVDKACRPISKFLMPSGEKDEAWLEKADMARANLRNVWKYAFALQNKLFDKTGLAQEHRQIYSDQTMRHFDTPQHLASLEDERGVVLQEALQRKLLGETTKPQDSGIPTQSTATIDVQEAPHAGVDSSEEINKAHVDILAQLENELQESHDVNSLEPPLIPHGPEQNPQGRNFVSPQKYKLKTRGIANEALLPVALPVIATPTSSPILYHLHAKHMPAIELLFGSSTVRGFMEWPMFVSFMLSLGFSAAHCGGSAVMFRGIVRLQAPDGRVLEEKRTIHVHKPHPDPQMEREILRNIGKRMSKHLGWQREHFAEAS